MADTKEKKYHKAMWFSGLSRTGCCGKRGEASEWAAVWRFVKPL